MSSYYSTGLIAGSVATLKAPTADGTAGQVIKTDGAGQLSFVDAPSGNVTKVGVPTANQIGVWTGDGTIRGDDGLTYDPADGKMRIGYDGSNAGKLWFKNSSGNDAARMSVIGGNDFVIGYSTANASGISIKYDSSTAIRIIGATMGVGTGSPVGRCHVVPASSGTRNLVVSGLAGQTSSPLMVSDQSSVKFAVLGSKVQIFKDNDGYYSDSPSNYTRLVIEPNATHFQFRAEAGGTGTLLPVQITPGLSVAGGKASLAASTTSGASLNIPSGTAPTTPANGDIWSDGSDIKVRLGGTTYTLTKS